MPNAMRSYASAILKTVDFLSIDEPDSPSVCMPTPLLTGMGDVQSLARRMRQISRSAKPNDQPWFRRTVIAGVATLTLPLGFWALAPTAKAQLPAAQNSPIDQSDEQKSEQAANAGGANIPKPIVVKSGTARQAAQEAQEALREKMKSLGSIASVDTPLATVVKQLGEKWRMPIALDTLALEEIGLTPDVPVSLNLKDASLRATLRLTCRSLDLTYMIKDDVIFITTPESAERNLAVRAYSLPEGLAERTDKVIAALTGTITPDTWEQLGGPSSVYAIKNVLVVSTTEDVHAKVEEFIVKVDSAYQKRKKMEAEK